MLGHQDIDTGFRNEEKLPLDLVFLAEQRTSVKRERFQRWFLWSKISGKKILFYICLQRDIKMVLIILKLCIKFCGVLAF